eukprot:UC1_evm1s1104
MTPAAAADASASASGGVPSLYPSHLQKAIDEVNEWVYHDVNNGVYKSGFARSQSAYDAAVSRLFAALERLDDLLDTQRFLVGGGTLTEADLRLVVTLLRFDAVYQVHFKCSLRRLTDTRNLHRYTADVYQTAGLAHVDFPSHYVAHYYRSHRALNPFGIVPKVPLYDWAAVLHGREKMES